MSIAIGQPVRIRTRLAVGVSWTVVMAVATQGSSLLSSVISARLLGREDFGKLAMLVSLVGMLSNLAGLGLGLTANKFVSELRDRAPDRAGRILGLCTIVTAATGCVYAIAIFVAAPWIATYFLKAEDLVIELRLCSLAVLFLTMNGYQLGALQGTESFSLLAGVACFLGPTTLALTVGLTWAFRLPGAAAVCGVGALVSWILHQVVLRRQCRRHHIRIRYDHLKQELSVLCHFAIPAALSGVVASLAITGASTLVVRQPGGFAGMGVFSAVMTIRTLALFLPNTLSRVSMPVLCNLRVNEEGNRYQRTLWTCVTFNAALTTCLAVLLCALSPYLLWVFGRGFVESRTVPALLLAGGVAEAVASGLYPVICGHGRMWQQFAVGLLWAALLFGATAWMLRHGGAIALASGYLAAWSVTAFVYIFVVRRLTRGEQGG